MGISRPEAERVWRETEGQLRVLIRRVLFRRLSWDDEAITDVLGDVWMEFDRTRDRLDFYDPSGWLRYLTVRKAKTYASVRWQKVSRMEPLGLTMPDETTVAPDAHHDALASVERVRRAVQALPKLDQELIRRRFYEEEDFKTISNDLNKPVGTLACRVHRGLARLRKELVEEAA